MSKNVKPLINYLSIVYAKRRRFRTNFIRDVRFAQVRIVPRCDRRAGGVAEVSANNLQTHIGLGGQASPGMPQNTETYLAGRYPRASQASRIGRPWVDGFQVGKQQTRGTTLAKECRSLIGQVDVARLTRSCSGECRSCPPLN